MISKVFYSWQSDLPNSTNRGLIGKALEDAAKSIRADESIEVTPVIDRDTSGVPGAPDIAGTIFEKIDQSDVFVCDVSIIDRSAARPSPNPNVLIELGYAMKTLGPGRVIMVMNTAYGIPEALPFDLRMRRVITYEATEDGADRAQVRKGLQGALTQGLRIIFEGMAGQMPGELVRASGPEAQVDISTFISAGDKEFEEYVVRLLTNNAESEFNVAVERLRDATVPAWGLPRRLAREDILAAKEETFLPTMRKLTMLGLLLIKYSAPLQWFGRVGDLLEEVFATSNLLIKAVTPEVKGQSAETLAEYAGPAVPAMESILATYLIGAYALEKRGGLAYLNALFPRVVDFIQDGWDTQSKGFLLFWPVDDPYWIPNRQRDLLVLERYGNDAHLGALLGDENAMRSAVLRIDCLVDWHSFMSMTESKEEAAVKFFRETYPGVYTSFVPNFTHESFSYIQPFVERLWTAVQSGSDGLFLLDVRLSEAIKNLPPERRKLLFARFLIYAERERAQWMYARRKLAGPAYWPREIMELVNKVKNLDQGNPQS